MFIFHVNTQLVNVKGDKLNGYLSIFKDNFDITCLTEICKGDETTSEFFLEHYKGFYFNVLSRMGGEACILASRKLNCLIIESSKINIDFVESFLVEILSNKRNAV